MTVGLQPTPIRRSARVLSMISSVAFAVVLSGCCGLCDDDKSASGATGGLGDECVDNTNCASGLFCSGGVCVSPGVPGANPGAPATAVADPVVPPQPVPAAVGGTVTANGLTLGTHGCTFYDSTGAYNRHCSLTQNAQSFTHRRYHRRHDWPAALAAGRYQVAAAIEPSLLAIPVSRNP